MLEIKQYTRKPFDIDAVQVTEENMVEVAQWCNGHIRTMTDTKTKKPVKYIKVRVYSPKNDKQTQAFVGDWVLYAGTGYKVYTKNAFDGTFDEKISLEPETIEALTKPHVRILPVDPPPAP